MNHAAVSLTRAIAGNLQFTPGACNLPIEWTDAWKLQHSSHCLIPTLADFGIGGWAGSSVKE